MTPTLEFRPDPDALFTCQNLHAAPYVARRRSIGQMR
jgi:hypothetical protein